jgi:hypothetical protein
MAAGPGQIRSVVVVVVVVVVVAVASVAFMVRCGAAVSEK